MAHYDKLTGVFNRNYLDVLMEYEAQKIQQEHYSTAFLMIDIDCFKYFNDEYGHDFGDKVLAEVAHVISRKLRESDYVGRFGGDEFLVILPKTSIADACAISRRILESTRNINVERSNETIGLSIGISELKQGVTPMDAWKHADVEMFKAKNNGGNQFSF
jgi:diguanylate cyclase (GGDEF)-like protein